MILLRHRPQVRLRMYPEVFPGETFDAAILLDAVREVPVERVSVAFCGREVRLLSNRPAPRISLVDLSARVSGPRRLRPGRTELPFKVPLPHGLPPSYEGRVARTRYELGVHVAIPWWPDRYERFVVRVARPRPETPGPPPPVLPGRFTTDRQGPRGTEPYMEGSLANVNIEPGSVLSGAVALSNMGANRYRRLTVSLVARERDPRGSSEVEVEIKRYELELSLEAVGEAEPIPFHLAVPTRLHPSCRSSLWELRWFVEARAELGWRPDLRFLVPVKVLPERGPRPALGPRIRVPPTIGSPRVEAIWREVGQSAGMAFEEDGLAGVVAGGVQVAVRREPRGRRGNFVVGELRYEPLGIGLGVRSLRGIERHWGSPSLSFGDPAWDRKNQIEGRDVAQVLAFGRSVVDALWAFSGVYIDDTTATVERRGTGNNRRVLEQFVSNVLQLARAVELGRAALPPPAEMERAVPRWQDLARRFHGSLVQADMSVVGTVHGMSVAVATEWAETGFARDTRVELVLPVPLARKYTATMGGATQALSLDDYPDEARELVGMIVDGADTLSVLPERLVLLLPAPLLDPFPFVSDRVEWMVQLGLALGSGGGPYR